MLKRRLETSTLENISASITGSISPEGMEIRIILNSIICITLGLVAQNIKETILTYKRKSKSNPMRKVIAGDVSVVGEYELVVYIDLETLKEKSLFYFYSVLAYLPSVKVSGIPSISRAVISYDEMGDECHLLCEGQGGLQDIMGKRGINGLKCVSNHIMEMNEVLGIEAGRQTIITEIRQVVSSYGISLDPRHLTLLADLMTYRVFYYYFQPTH